MGTMRNMKLLLATIVFVMAGIGLFTNNNALLPFLFLLLGLLMFIQGVDERKKNHRSVLSYASFAIAAFLWLISFSIFLET